MSSNRNVLTVELHFGVDLAACDALDTLQAFLCAFVPGYCSDLRVLRYERDREAIAVDLSCDSQLREAVLAQGGYRGEAYDALAASGLSVATFEPASQVSSGPTCLVLPTST